MPENCVWYALRPHVQGYLHGLHLDRIDVAEPGTGRDRDEAGRDEPLPTTPHASRWNARILGHLDIRYGTVSQPTLKPEDQIREDRTLGQPAADSGDAMTDDEEGLGRVCDPWHGLC